MNNEIRNYLTLNGLGMLITLFIHNPLLITLFGYMEIISYLYSCAFLKKKELIGCGN
jgi:hypothetical protein